jgi:hypothetical protein
MRAARTTSAAIIVRRRSKRSVIVDAMGAAMRAGRIRNPRIPEIASPSIDDPRVRSRTKSMSPNVATQSPRLETAWPVRR